MAEREPVQRFIIEENYKPAIFGSHLYDPIKQVFESIPKIESHDQIVNETLIMSTAVGNDVHHNNTGNNLRRHTTAHTSKQTTYIRLSKPYRWRGRSNSTSNNLINV